MFSGFAHKMCKELIANEFSIVKRQENEILSEGTRAVILIKIDNPVIYFVSLVNMAETDKREYMTEAKRFSEIIEKDLSYYRCTRAVWIDIFVYASGADEDIYKC